jgi:hypothetical protein
MGITKDYHEAISQMPAAATVDLLTGCVVAPRVDFPSPAIQVPTRDVRFAQSSQPTAGMLSASRLASGQNLSPRHLLLFMK